MLVSYSPDYVIALPEGHPFPMPKFSALYELLLEEQLIESDDVMIPEEASWSDLQLFHTTDYLHKLENATQTHAEVRRMGVPWSRALVRRSRLAVTGTINAMRAAMTDSIAANLSGGTHHAMPDHGQGFCVLNDVAVGVRMLKRDRLFRRVLVIDLDVHQGNGNAVAFADDAEVFTFSLHGERNFPLHKPPSSLDVALPDDTKDEHYLNTLAEHLPGVFECCQPEIVLYLAGVDPMAGDRYGRLSLTREGLHQRDRMVLEATRLRNIPLTLLLSGGYAKTPQLTADLHAITHREAARVYEKIGNSLCQRW